ncbi:MAG: hypothetical protein HYS80_02665, partial [Candidatus Aenigmarchaeota archaeon]|nr:hypothetical protein [Candidatus Aenigmarchaeota archaeon]
MRYLFTIGFFLILLSLSSIAYAVSLVQEDNQYKLLVTVLGSVSDVQIYFDDAAVATTCNQDKTSCWYILPPLTAGTEHTYYVTAAINGKQVRSPLTGTNSFVVSKLGESCKTNCNLCPTTEVCEIKTYDKIDKIQDIGGGKFRIYSHSIDNPNCVAFPVPEAYCDVPIRMQRVGVPPGGTTVSAECTTGEVTQDSDLNDILCENNVLYTCVPNRYGNVFNINDQSGFDILCIDNPPWNSFTECDVDGSVEHTGQHGDSKQAGTIININGYDYICTPNQGYESWIACGTIPEPDGAYAFDGTTVNVGDTTYYCCSNKWQTSACSPGFYNCDLKEGCESTTPCGRSNICPAPCNSCTAGWCGVEGELGLRKADYACGTWEDNRFYCYQKTHFVCTADEHYDPAWTWATRASNCQQVGSYYCDQANNRWTTTNPSGCHQTCPYTCTSHDSCMSSNGLFYSGAGYTCQNSQQACCQIIQPLGRRENTIELMKTAYTGLTDLDSYMLDHTNFISEIMHYTQTSETASRYVVYNDVIDKLESGMSVNSILTQYRSQLDENGKVKKEIKDALIAR